MINALLQIAFTGCAHQKMTFPRSLSGGLGRTYVVCLDCGTEFDYDWTAMRRGAPVRARRFPDLKPVPSAPVPSCTRVAPVRQN